MIWKYLPQKVYYELSSGEVFHEADKKLNENIVDLALIEDMHISGIPYE